MAQNLLVIISAPSGTGKSTLCEKLCDLFSGMKYSISWTTRLPRHGEIHGHDYFFVSEKKFQEKLKRNGFLEWASVHGYYYGTPRDFVEKNLAKDKDILLNIDVQGAMKIRKIYPEAVLIFLIPPTFAELEKRLRARHRDSPEEIRKRLNHAKKELNYIRKYDYLVVNDKLEKAVNQARAIIIAEKRRISRLKEENYLKYFI